MAMRGPKPKSEALKALQGNPGRKKLLHEEAALPPMNDPVAAPEFLKEEREKQIFRRVVNDYLQRRIAHDIDVTAYGRWAHYVHLWLTTKDKLDGKATFLKISSKVGDRLVRNPLFTDLLDLERVMVSLEDRLGLNPQARQNIIRSLAAMPGTAIGRQQEAKAEVQQPREDAPSPIGIGRLN